MKTLNEVKAQYLNEAMASPVGGYVVMDRKGKVLAHSTSPFVHCYTDPLDLEWAKANGYETKDEEIDGRILTWVTAKERPGDLFRSADGNYYLANELPEYEDEFVTKLYASTVRAERNARITDTDDYLRLADITVQKVEGEPREALTDEDRQAIMAYRDALRDLPKTQGFPFVEFPELPKCIAYECGQKIATREAKTMMRGGF